MTAHPERPVVVRLDSALDRLGLTGPFRRDCALAALLAVVSAGSILLLPILEPAVGAGPFPMTATVVIVVAQAVLLAARRVGPAACLTAVAGLQLLVPFLLDAGEVIRGPATVVAAYTCATLLAPRRTALITAGAAGLECAAIVVAAAVAPGPVGGTPTGLVVAQVVSVPVLYVGAVLVGSYVATRRRYLAVMASRATEEIEALRTRADAAVVRERTRMARELHDIAAHHLSAMVVQTAMIEKLVDRDPERAKQTAAAARRQGRETLRDLRMVVGALRDDPAGDRPTDIDDVGPVPGLGDLDRLVETHRGLGTTVSVERTGEPFSLAPVADVTGYRVVQEALANARDHAPGAPVRIALDRTGDAVTVTVANPLPATGATTPLGGRGFGLTGMRERAHLVGAEFRSGPTPAGTWQVQLVARAATDGTGAT